MKFSWKQGTGLSENQLLPAKKKLEGYRKRLEQIAEHTDYAQPESSIQLSFDRTLQVAVETEVLHAHPKTVQDVVLIGIGGSSLGTSAVYDALSPTRALKRLHVLDTLSPINLRTVADRLRAHKSERAYTVCVVSKSGGTTETIANAMTLEVEIKKQHPKCLDRFVVITDEGSALWNRARERNMRVLAVPAMVGGRFSVMSAVGLFPLALLGVDIRQLLSGARKAVRDNTQNSAQNSARASAAIVHHQWKHGRAIHDTFVFNPELESLGKWVRQLTAESLGKRENLSGKEVRVGITPTVSVGSSDLHSMAQLSIGGPADKFTTFVHSAWAQDARVPQRSTFDRLVADAQAQSYNGIMSAIRKGTHAAYRSAGHPYVEVELEGLSEKELGAYMQFRMIETMYLAQLMRVNAFDQPAVEAYKSVTRRLLKRAKK
ncbi:hypothetical protein A3C17_02665 [Candidatus Uhrbacteria bacterium RIFCSPHIGHO2_02_FULL_53_13]|uniref:Glucose-6-phosphate isomerase n=1 Tax=Candidatus Uhrbacteria bacterium RIFCSPHIGHO2_02_FULL_53_13 TaxID=1802389 RepID=A0A1F7U1C5_9BACT|nr:MAG: hypothetical protein A3C17_02665 [Candidatus Uhrbacteria bacterium RIFCSPHIGHO2_02_FULL_53_13]